MAAQKLGAAEAAAAALHKRFPDYTRLPLLQAALLAAAGKVTLRKHKHRALGSLWALQPTHCYCCIVARGGSRGGSCAGEAAMAEGCRFAVPCSMARMTGNFHRKQYPAPVNRNLLADWIGMHWCLQAAELTKSAVLWS